ncbi:MAG: hypothetical protein MR373_07850 [Faecalibacterium prausnitzii]|nr:hypothetical protein [Faecalibacterium prausnitzii]
MGKLMWEQPPFCMTCFYNIIYHIILHESIDDVEKLWQITKKLPLSGELDGVLALSVTCGDSSPKGRALGKTKDFAVLPMPLPLGEVDLRSKDGEGEDAALNHAAAGLH